MPKCQYCHSVEATWVIQWINDQPSFARQPRRSFPVAWACEACKKKAQRAVTLPPEAKKE